MPKKEPWRPASKSVSPVVTLCALVFDVLGLTVSGVWLVTTLNATPLAVAAVVAVGMTVLAILADITRALRASRRGEDG